MILSKIAPLSLAMLLFLGLGSPWARGQNNPAWTAVLDFKMEEPAPGREHWAFGLADYFEVFLQQQEVATLERRQIRLILAERNLLESRFISPDTLVNKKLPAVSFFIRGSVKRSADGQFL